MKQTGYPKEQRVDIAKVYDRLKYETFDFRYDV